tara:strand:+ start:2849 stop:3232 length:384 start_codon:yes stop_codon:yes gene_type:complete
MAKSQKISRSKPKKVAAVIDERSPQQLTTQYTNPEVANGPVRTVNFVEVGEMVGKQLQLILQRLNATHDTAKGGIHYFLPVRNGKIGSDIIFEEEFLKIVNETCEVVGDKIMLKDGAKEVTVIRRKL